MSANHCHSCAFYDARTKAGPMGAGPTGVCRFNPPVSQPAADAHGLWPVVGRDDWCGHHAPAAGRAAAG